MSIERNCVVPAALGYFREAIARNLSVFVWCETPEGYEYWDKVWRLIRVVPTGEASFRPDIKLTSNDVLGYFNQAFGLSLSEPLSIYDTLRSYTYGSSRASYLDQEFTL